MVESVSTPNSSGSGTNNQTSNKSTYYATSKPASSSASTPPPPSQTGQQVTFAQGQPITITVQGTSAPPSVTTPTPIAGTTKASTSSGGTGNSLTTPTITASTSNTTQSKLNNIMLQTLQPAQSYGSSSGSSPVATQTMATNMNEMQGMTASINDVSLPTTQATSSASAATAINPYASTYVQSENMLANGLIQDAERKSVSDALNIMYENQLENTFGVRSLKNVAITSATSPMDSQANLGGSIPTALRVVSPDSSMNPSSLSSGFLNELYSLGDLSSSYYNLLNGSQLVYPVSAVSAKSVKKAKA